MEHKPFSELVAKMSPEAQKRSQEMANRILAEMELSELRAALDVKQVDLAKKLHTTQAAISRLEKQANNTKLSTLQNYAEALGGELEIRVALPDRPAIRLKNLIKAKKGFSLRARMVRAKALKVGARVAAHTPKAAHRGIPRKRNTELAQAG